MIVPPGMTEQEVVAAVERVLDALAHKLPFGYHTADDIRQQGWLLALEALASGKYDPGRPLANFLYRHVKNRLLNLKRKQQKRAEVPCARCARSDYCGSDGAPCRRHTAWEKNNKVKANLMHPVDLDGLAAEQECAARTQSEAAAAAELTEMERALDEGIPVELRSTYLRMRAGLTVPRDKRAAVEAACRSILEDDRAV